MKLHLPLMCWRDSQSKLLGQTPRVVGDIGSLKSAMVGIIGTMEIGKHYKLGPFFFPPDNQLLNLYQHITAPTLKGFYEDFET